MGMTVLELRLEALAGHLDKARDPFGWFNMLELPSWCPPPEPWRAAVGMVQEEAQRACSDLQDAIDGLATGGYTEQQAWSTYAEVKQKSDAIFREFMDLLGGLALRDRLKEEYVCRFADELIKDCAADVGRGSLFAIPAFELTFRAERQFEDPLSSTLRRAARVRFPDWHLWTLPLVALEYGHVALHDNYFGGLAEELTGEQVADDIRQIIDRARQEVTELAEPSSTTTWVLNILDGVVPSAPSAPVDLKQAAELLSKGPEPKGAQYLKQAGDAAAEYWTVGERRVLMLLADAFAAFTTGPAFACAALFFRLDPRTTETPGRPADSERAELILSLLDEMSSCPGASTSSDFSGILKDLRTYWAAVVRASGVGQVGPATVPIDTRRILKRFRHSFAQPDKAEYSSSDWSRSLDLADSWFKSLELGCELKLPDNMSAYKRSDYRLRDVLNAAWDCRLRALVRFKAQQRDDARESVEKAARQLCDAIITPTSNSTDHSQTFGGKSQRPGPGA